MKAPDEQASPGMMISGSRYSAAERRAAVGLFVVLGNIERVAQACSIPARTIRDWAKQPWWADLVAEVRQEKQEAIDGALTEVIHSAVEALKDRIANGELVLSNGKLIRKPISARDAALVAAIAFDKRQLLRAKPTMISENQGDRLERLAERLVRLLHSKQGRTIDGQAIPVENGASIRESGPPTRER